MQTMNANTYLTFPFYANDLIIIFGAAQNIGLNYRIVQNFEGGKV